MSYAHACMLRVGISYLLACRVLYSYCIRVHRWRAGLNTACCMCSAELQLTLHMRRERLSHDHWAAYKAHDSSSVVRTRDRKPPAGCPSSSVPLNGKSLYTGRAPRARPPFKTYGEGRRVTTWVATYLVQLVEQSQKRSPDKNPCGPCPVEMLVREQK